MLNNSVNKMLLIRREDQIEGFPDEYFLIFLITSRYSMLHSNFVPETPKLPLRDICHRLRPRGLHRKPNCEKE